MPYPDNFVNLLIADRPGRVGRAELLRVLAPRGTLVVRRGTAWRKTVKPVPPGLDDWGHFFHGADGNPASADTRVGPPRRLQWTSGPRWARHHDHMASLTALVSSGGRVFMSTAGGALCCITPHPGNGLDPMTGRPLRIAWDHPENPKYLLPPPVPRDKDFDVLRNCKLFSAAKGFYRIQSTRKKTTGIALKKLARPITRGRVMLRTRIRPALDHQGFLNNGFIAFGASPAEGDLIHCGVRIFARQVLIVQGPLRKGGRTASRPLQSPPRNGRVMPLTVEVDLDRGLVRCRAGKSTVEARLRRPTTLAYLGFAMDSALIEMAPIQVQRLPASRSNPPANQQPRPPRGAEGKTPNR